MIDTKMVSEAQTEMDKRRTAREKGRQRGRDLRKYMRTSASAYEIGLSVVVGMVMGLFVDKWLGTAPWGFLWFSIAGVLNVVRTVYALIQKQKVMSEAEALAKEDADASDGAKA